MEFALILPLVVIVAAAAFLAARRGPLRTLVVADELLPAAVSANRYFRRRSLLAMLAVVVFGTVLGVGVIFSIRTASRELTDSNIVTDPLQWLVLTPLFIGVVAVASFAFVPRFREMAEVRTAELTRRTPLTFGPRWAWAVPSVSAALLVAIVVWFGLIAEPDGRMFVYDDGPGGGFPGFSYGVPVLGGLAVIAAVAIAALLRIAGAPRPSDQALRSADDTVRLLALRITLNSVTAAITMTAGILLVWAGSTAESMARTTRIDLSGVPLPPDAALQAIGVWGTVGIWAGIACFAATVGFLVRAVSDATRTPFASAAVSETVVSETTS